MAHGNTTYGATDNHHGGTKGEPLIDTAKSNIKISKMMNYNRYEDTNTSLGRNSGGGGSGGRGSYTAANRHDSDDDDGGDGGASSNEMVRTFSQGQIPSTSVATGASSTIQQERGSLFSNGKKAASTISTDASSSCGSDSTKTGNSSSFMELINQKKPPISKWTKIYAFCAALNSVNLGYDIGVSTNAGPLIMDHFNLSDFQLEMFLGSINFWSIFGALISPILTDRCGRRLTFATAACGFIVGVFIMATSPNFEQLLFGRFLVGLGVGIGEAIDPMYIAEIAPPHCRGELVSWAEAGVAVGVVLGFASSLIPGVGGNWREMLSLGAILPFVMIILVSFVMPESPRWLVEKNMEDKARVVLAKIYPSEQEPILGVRDEDGNNNAMTVSNPAGKESDDSTTNNSIDKVIQDIHESLELEQAAASAVGWSAILVRPSPAVRRMLLVGIGMAIIQQACGIDSIMFYLMFVIKQSGIQSDAGQNAALIGLGMVKLLFVFVGAKLFDRLGRRPLLFTSLLGCTASLLVVSATFRSDSELSKVTTILALGFYLAFFSTGLGPGNWVVISEIFATSIRAKAMSVAVFPNRVTATIMASTFLTLAHWLTWPGFFLLLAGICLSSALFLFVYLPETKNKSLESMSKYFAEVTGDRSILDMEDHLRQLKEERRAALRRAKEERAHPEAGGLSPDTALGEGTKTEATDRVMT